MSQIKRLAARWLSGRARYVGFVFCALPGNAGRLVFLCCFNNSKIKSSDMDSSPTIHAGPLGAQTQYQDGYDVVIASYGES